MLAAQMSTAPCAGCETCALAQGWVGTSGREKGAQAGGYAAVSGPIGTAEVLVVGAAPTREDVSIGKAMSGRSGRLLKSALASAGIDPELEVAYTNLVACRPPGNKPLPEHLHACSVGLRAIELFTGSTILLVSRVAADRILGAQRLSDIVRKRATWDGYVHLPEDVPDRVDLGSILVPTGAVYKSGKQEGKPKLTRQKLYGKVPKLAPAVRGLVGVLDPYSVAKRGFSNIFQMRSAVFMGALLARGDVIYRGPDMMQCQTVLAEWPDPEFERTALVYDIENTELGLTRIGFREVCIETGKFGRLASFSWTPGVRALTARLLGPDSPYEELVAHNASYDIGQLLAFENIETRGAGLGEAGDGLFCTMMAAQLDQPDLPKGLGAMWRYLGPALPWKHLADDSPVRYNAQDVDVTAKIYVFLRRRLAKNGQADLMCREMASIMVLDRMTRHGLKRDERWVRAFADDAKAEIERILDEWEALSGLRVLAGARVQAWFYEERECPVLDKTSTGQPSTADKTFRHLLDLGAELDAQARRGIELVLAARKLQKQIGTYCAGFDERVDENGVLHPSYLPSIKDSGDLGTASGRLSSSPNIQNVPKGLRDMFVPSFDGWVIGDSDLSAVEGRVAAALAGDQDLLSLYDTPGLDMHTINLENAFVELRALWQERRTAATRKSDRAFWQERLDVDAAYAGDICHHPTLDRKRIKTFLYGYQYGAGDQKIADSLRLHIREAEAIRGAYETSRPCTTEHRKKVVLEARTSKRLQNAFGRIRYFQGAVPDAHVRNAAINYGPQSTVADMFWHWFPAVEQLLARHGGALLTQVHDSFVWEAPGDRVDAIVLGLSAIMQQEWPQVAAGFWVPVTHEVGPRWGSVVPYDEWVKTGRPLYFSLA